MRCNYNPQWRKIGKGVMVGLELEFEHDSGPDMVDADYSEVFTEEELSYLAAVKEDGSVDGAEFVTQPAAYDKHQEYLPGILRKLHDLGFYASHSCGLHVHVERPENNELRVRNILKAIVRASTEEWDDLFYRVQGRGSTQYAYEERVRDCPVSEYTRDSRVDKFLRFNTLHQDTYEFRQGHGSIRISRVMRRMELAMSLVEWAKTCFQDILETKNPAEELALYREWLSAQPGYPVLTGFLESC
ncbi:amidoligase family protein [Acidithiobacillus sp. M4-SHS-6]|uniref:amidoligase family protein n=1 Tax=Acidithiobacillus sp. M4-SHS-6 TaxID=3383024 RepID=UPI0039BE4D4F